MSENNKICVTTSSQTISANVKVDNSGYFTEKAQQYAEQSEASAQKSQANVDRLLANEDFINVSQNLDLIVEAGQKIEGIDLEAILNAEASAKQSSESALASANLSEENAQITTTNAQLSKTYRDESEEFSEASKNYMNNALSYKQQASTFRDLCYDISIEAREQALDSQVYSNNSLTYSNNAKTSETNALTYSNNAKTSEENALKYSNTAKDYLDEVKEIVPTNFTTLPIGSVISINASASYIPNGFLPCDGAEYSKADFEKLWDNYFYSGNYETNENVTYSLIGDFIRDGGFFYNCFGTFYFNVIGYPTIVFKFLIGEDVKTEKFFNTFTSLKILNGKLYSQDVELTEIKPNSSIYIKEIINANTTDEKPYNITFEYSLNGTDFVSFSTETKTLSSILFTLGTSQSSTWDIDLASSYYELDGKKHYIRKEVGLLNTCTYEEFEQDLATYGQCGKFAVKPLGYDGSGLTIVGSPTITEDGIASELSQTGYLTIPFIDFKNKSFKYKTRVKFNALNIDRNVIFGQSGGDYKFLSLICENQKFRLYTPKDGTAWDVYTVTDFIVQIDTWYDIELISDLTNIVFKVNGETVLTKSWKGITYDIGTNTVCLGTTLNLTAWKFTGSIDLKQFSIIVDGQTVFDCVSGDTFKVPTIADTELGFKHFIAVSNGTVDDCLATWNAMLEIEALLKEV